MIDEENIQVGAILISSVKSGHLHFHCLALGRNRTRKTLLDCSRNKWEGQWPWLCRIKEVVDLQKTARYIAIHFYGWKSSHTEVDSFGTNLLRREMVLLSDGLDAMLV